MYKWSWISKLTHPLAGAHVSKIESTLNEVYYVCKSVLLGFVELKKNNFRSNYTYPPIYTCFKQFLNGRIKKKNNIIKMCKWFSGLSFQNECVHWLKAIFTEFEKLNQI